MILFVDKVVVVVDSSLSVLCIKRVLFDIFLICVFDIGEIIKCIVGAITLKTYIRNFAVNMHEIANKSTFQQIQLIRKYLKLKVLEDNITFRKHEKARSHIYDVMKRTVSGGESHSALMIGPRGSGKTTVSTLYHYLAVSLTLIFSG